MEPYYLHIFLAAMLVVFLATPMMRKLAFRFNILDVPDQNVKTHKKPTPYLGGVAVFLGILSVAAVVLILDPSFASKRNVFFLTLLAITFVVGLIDDIRPSTPLSRFMFHILVSCFAVYMGFHFRSPLPMPLNYLASVLWIAGIINAMNIIDIMDGLASGVAFTVCLSMMAGMYFISPGADASFAFLLVVTTSGACFAFLFFNFEKASIFLGDAGSTTLGFLLGAISLKLPYMYKSYHAVFAPVFFLGIPVFEVFLVSILRMKKRQSPFRASKDHFALRAKMKGFSVKQIVLGSYFVSLLYGAMAVAIFLLPRDWKFPLIVGVLLVSVLMGWVFSRVKVN